MILGSKAVFKLAEVTGAEVVADLIELPVVPGVEGSKRNSNRVPRSSLIQKFLKRDMFQLSRPGPRAALCPRLPNVPIAGSAKAGRIEVLNDLLPGCANRLRIGDLADQVRDGSSRWAARFRLFSADTDVEGQTGLKCHNARCLPATKHGFHQAV